MSIKNNNDLKLKISEVIQYFSIFKYPLLLEEIYKYISLKSSKKVISETLSEMVKVKEIYQNGDFYSDLSNINELVIKRKKLNHYAKKLLKKSVFYSSLLSFFPFVRGIVISGSLSKQCANENSDIDFFVIVKKNRLWICKTIIQIFKNILRLFGKEEYMCTNYFKANDNLSLEEKSKFTEMELITMIPVYNPKVLKQFFKSNAWAFDKYLNLNFSFENNYQSSLYFPFKILKTINEFILDLIGDSLDDYLMKKTKKRWLRAHLDDFDSLEDFDRSIKIRKNEIKYHLNSSSIKVSKKKISS